MRKDYQMNYSKQYISKVVQETGYLANNLEKVIRLLDVLDFIFSKSSFKDALSLKGGTAINLVYTDLRRLSVDIDLDYHRFLEKERVIEDRESILRELDDYMESEGYVVSDKSRGSVILASRMYSYKSAFGNNDNIKVEINFIDRVSVCDVKTTIIEFFGKQASVILPTKEEVYAMKIAALIDRSKPRDLYDVDYFFNNIFGDVDKSILRKMVTFYLSLDGIFDVNNSLYDGIRSISKSSVKRELMPVLKKDEKFILEDAQNRVIELLSDLLSLSENELSYLKSFSKGDFNPTLLFDKETAERVANHPMAKWRALNIEKAKNKF